MIMTMSNQDMNKAYETLLGINETGKLGYAVARNTRKIADACKEYMDIRNELFKKYSRDLPNGGKVIRDECREDYFRELGDYPEIEHDVDIFTVSEDVFCGGNLTSKQMENLLWMVTPAPALEVIK